MPRFVWLADGKIDGAVTVKKMEALRKIGVPYTDADIAGAAAAVEGKSELDALIAYLQGLGTNLKRNLRHGHRHGARIDYGCAVHRVLALVFWAYSKRRKADFDELARMPLEDDPPVKDSGSKTP